MKKILYSLLIATMTITSFAGCGQNKTTASNDAPRKSVESSAKEEASFPMTIKHAFGSTTIEKKPERIVNLGWGNQDTTLALGVVPVGVSAANYGLRTKHNLHPWTDEAFASLKETSPNVFSDENGWDYEAIAASEPDVIIASYSGFTEEEYKLLSEIAPVVPFEDVAWKTNWREQTLTNSKAMGLADEGKKLVEKTDKLIEDKLKDYPALEGKTAAYFWISQDDMSTFYAYLPNDPRAAYLNDFGLKTPESILSLAKTSEDFSVTLSRENTDLLNDVDIMVVYGDQGLLDALQADPLMSQIPAVKNGSVVLIDSTTALAAATTPSILSIPYAVDDYLKLLNDAAEKIKPEA